MCFNISQLRDYRIPPVCLLVSDLLFYSLSQIEINPTRSSNFSFWEQLRLWVEINSLSAIFFLTAKLNWLYTWLNIDIVKKYFCTLLPVEVPQWKTELVLLMVHIAVVYCFPNIFSSLLYRQYHNLIDPILWWRIIISSEIYIDGNFVHIKYIAVGINRTPINLRLLLSSYMIYSMPPAKFWSGLLYCFALVILFIRSSFHF